jgi:serine/threonine-protein kinase
MRWLLGGSVSLQFHVWLFSAKALEFMPESAPIVMDGDPARDSLTGTIAGRFEIESRVGIGGMGEVYRAQDTRLKCPVALKRLSPALRNDALYKRRLMEEAQRAAQMRGEPRVAAVYDFLQTDDEFFLIMEFVEGETLRHRIARPMQLQEFLHIARQCADALVAASGRGILHGDIKPENIMITPAGHVKILDFGVAKKVWQPDLDGMNGDGTNDETIDRFGTLSGTPAYMAPEILLHKPADGRADIFSLGIVFYEVLTGHHPFRADNAKATTDHICGTEPAPARSFNRDVTPALESILQRMLAKDPGHRFSNASELRAELDHLQPNLTPARLHRLLPLPSPPPRPPSARKGFLLGAAAVALLAVLSQVPQISQLWETASNPSVIHLVVLPLRTSSTDLNDRALCDGLTEALALSLAQFGNKTRVDVVPPSEVRAESVVNLDQARKKFGANRVLEGAVSESGGQARVIYSLIDATTGHTLDGDTITASNADRLAIEDHLVASVARILGMKPREDRMEQGTHEPAAYDYYLRGRGYLQDYHKPENVDSAIEVFKHALERDPNYARAFAGLGESYWRKYEQTHTQSWVALAGDACKRAVDLDKDLAIAHNCLGVVSNGTGEYQQATDEFQRAANLDPTNDDALLGLASAYDKLGRPQEAENYFKRAIQLHPQYWRGYLILGNFYFNSARYREAEEQYRRLTMLVPEGEFGYSDLGATYLAEGRYSEAVSEFKLALQLQSNATTYSNLATSYFLEHRFVEAARTYEIAIQQKDAEYWQWGNLAEAYALAPGESERVRPAYLKASELVNQRLRVNPRDAQAIHDAGLYQAMLGNREVALALLRRLPERSPRSPEMLWLAAKIHHRLGMNDQALAELEKSVSAGYSRAWIRDDPAFADLASNLHFQMIVK